jgi:hypothetical protein
MSASPHGSNLGKGKGTLTTSTGDAFTCTATQNSRKGAQVNKNAAGVAFPGGMCVELWYVNGTIVGKKFSSGWFKYTGSAWVPANPANDM